MEVEGLSSNKYANATSLMTIEHLVQVMKGSCDYMSRMYPFCLSFPVKHTPTMTAAL
jgi:hypothetical protein